MTSLLNNYKIAIKLYTGINFDITKNILKLMYSVALVTRISFLNINCQPNAYLPGMGPSTPKSKVQVL